MPPDTVHAVTLNCHPETPTDAVRCIAARVCRSPGGVLAVAFVLEGDLGRLRMPAPRAPRIASGLWRHTCCEIFIARKGLPAYHEFDLSPSGEWAAYAFDDYRSPCAGDSHTAGPGPQFAVHAAADKLEIDAVIHLDGLSVHYPGARLSLALSAVVEHSDGALSYWALRHPPGKPDFHHPEAFAMDLNKVAG